MNISSTIMLIFSVYIYVVIRQTVYNRVYCLEKIREASKEGKLFKSFDETAMFFERILQTRKESNFILLAWSTAVTIALASRGSFYFILFFLLSCSGYVLYYKAFVEHRDFISDIKRILDELSSEVVKIQEEIESEE